MVRFLTCLHSLAPARQVFTNQRFVGLRIMTTQRELVEQLFEGALACAPSERAAFLDQACSRHPELRRTVEELLAEDANAGSFLEHPPLAFLDEEALCARLSAATGPLDLNDLALPGGRLVPNQILIDRFIIVRFIAKGGMGEVYEAADCLLQGAKVAVKTILPQMARDPDLQQRFESEVLLARRVHHSNLCPIYDIFHCHQPPPSFLFLTMKLLTGETLAARLRRSASISIREGLTILRQLAAGLAAVHAAGIVHGDIKPNNIMLDGAGLDMRLWITDFGLARAFTGETSLSGNELAAGTPDYMAPEVHRGVERTQASDLFAMGVVLHQVFTGERPLQARDKSYIVVSPRLNTLGIPSFCVKLITECLDREPQRRSDAFVRALGPSQIIY
jgi:eukaryotic-like serine/threonine-protein kinase